MADEIKTDAFTGGVETLPPPGDERREVLAKRQDALDKQIDEMDIEAGTIPHDHDAFNPERNREIQYAISENYLEVGVNHPYLKTKWVNWKNQDGHMVWKAKVQQWQTATIREFPEAKPYEKEDGTIRVGDVILMCIRMDLYHKIEMKERDKRLRQQFGVEADIHDFAEGTNRKYGKQVFANVQTPGEGSLGETALDAMEQRAILRQQAAHVTARHLGNRMKKGTIPGIPVK